MCRVRFGLRIWRTHFQQLAALRRTSLSPVFPIVPRKCGDVGGGTVTLYTHRARKPLMLNPYPRYGMLNVSEECIHFSDREGGLGVRNMSTNIGQAASTRRAPDLDLKQAILDRIRRDRSVQVWTPNDFLGLGTRSAVDKALQRMALSGELRRIDRGLYDLPRVNALTGKPSSPDYTAIIDAVARREQARFLPDGITAANQLGLTNAVPAKVTVHTDARLRPIHVDRLIIDFKLTAPSRLYWVGRPAMRIVQALHWLHDLLPTEGDSILKKIRKILEDPKQGKAIRDDLKSGLDALPVWMRELVTRLLDEADTQTSKNTAPADRSRGSVDESRFF